MRTIGTRLRRILANIGALYRNNMFVRWMAFFAAVAAVSIALFSYLLFSYMSQSIIDTERKRQQSAMERIGEDLRDKYDSARTFMNSIYRDSWLSNDMVNYIRLPFEDYLIQRLDRSFEASIAVPAKITDVLKNTLQDRPEVQHILLYSAERQYLHTYSQGRNPQSFHTNAARSYVPDVMALETAAVSVPNIWVRKAAQLDGELIAMRVPVNDPNSMLNIGQLMFLYRSDTIDHILSGYEEKLKGYIVVMSLDGQVFFDSSARYYGKPYPYMDKINDPSGREMLETDSYVTTVPYYSYGFIVAGITPVKELEASYQGVKRTIIAIGSLCILIVVLFPSIVVVNFAKRTHTIIRFMRKAETGDLSSRLPVEREDELGQISRSYNKMVEELSRHIEREYKAEIKQKQAELTALQARVQPHFLYNTLEVIRMRAVASGIHDVADMIYSLAMLFKSFVRPEHRTTLQEELENCRLYLELFRIRYQDRFSYSIDCEPELERLPTVRMLIQPIIENYIVHGLRKERTDNVIRIRAFQRGDDAVIEVSDNGKGISREKAAEINALLKRPDDEGESFGLRSVHQRLELLYGPPYGVTLAASDEGTTVTVTFPLRDAAGGNGSEIQ